MEFTTIEEAKKYVHDTYDNILVEDVHPGGEYCYIFFSSNGICDEEPLEKYTEALIEKGRYEWTSIAGAVKKHKSTGRCIYVRDAYKCFYIHGVSAECNSIDKTVERLASLVSDRKFKIVTIGISSGGYMSVICGIKLKAYKIFNISGQYVLGSRIPEVYDEFVSINPSYGSTVDLIKEYNISSDSDKSDIYYFCPIGCDHDREQYGQVKDIPCIKTFLFPDKIHAATVYPFNFPDLLMISRKKLDRLYHIYEGELINKKGFLLRTMSLSGWAEFIRRACKSKLNVGNMKRVWDVK